MFLSIPISQSSGLPVNDSVKLCGIPYGVSLVNYGFPGSLLVVFSEVPTLTRGMHGLIYRLARTAYYAEKPHQSI